MPKVIVEAPKGNTYVIMSMILFIKEDQMCSSE